jgi:hypothetical protein
MAVAKAIAMAMAKAMAVAKAMAMAKAMAVAETAVGAVAEARMESRVKPMSRRLQTPGLHFRCSRDLSRLPESRR